MSFVQIRVLSSLLLPSLQPLQCLAVFFLASFLASSESAPPASPSPPSTQTPSRKPRSSPPRSSTTKTAKQPSLSERATGSPSSSNAPSFSLIPQYSRSFSYLSLVPHARRPKSRTTFFSSSTSPRNPKPSSSSFVTSSPKPTSSTTPHLTSLPSQIPRIPTSFAQSSKSLPNTNARRSWTSYRSNTFLSSFDLSLSTGGRLRRSLDG